MDGTTFDEATAVFEAQQGDRAAFGALAQAYQRRAYGIAYSFVRNREDALELAQDSFVRAYKAMDRFDTSMPFYPWLYRIIKNTCLNYLKKKGRRGETSLEGLMESGYDVSRERDGVESQATAKEQREIILAAIAELSAGHGEIIMLRHFQELSYGEIAQCLGIPQGTVMSRLHSARRKLRETLVGKIDF